MKNQEREEESSVRLDGPGKRGEVVPNVEVKRQTKDGREIITEHDRFHP